jgi:hypothetical protein
MDALPEWPEGTVATLVTQGDAPHAIPVSLIVRAGPREIVVGLSPRREALARLRADPRAALTILAAVDHALTALGRATGFEEVGRVIAVRIAVERIADHNRPSYEIRDGVRWEWTDPVERERDAEARAALRSFANLS